MFGKKLCVVLHPSHPLPQFGPATPLEDAMVAVMVGLPGSAKVEPTKQPDGAMQVNT